MKIKFHCTTVSQARNNSISTLLNEYQCNPFAKPLCEIHQDKFALKI